MFKVNKYLYTLILACWQSTTLSLLGFLHISVTSAFNCCHSSSNCPPFVYIINLIPRPELFRVLGAVSPDDPVYRLLDVTYTLVGYEFGSGFQFTGSNITTPDLSDSLSTWTPHSFSSMYYDNFLTSQACLTSYFLCFSKDAVQLQVLCSLLFPTCLM